MVKKKEGKNYKVKREVENILGNGDEAKGIGAKRGAERN
jgi:hypothetical protein